MVIQSWNPSTVNKDQGNQCFVATATDDGKDAWAKPPLLKSNEQLSGLALDVYEDITELSNKLTSPYFQ